MAVNADIGRALERLDYLHAPAPNKPHREWLHFVVHGGAIDIVLNLSVVVRRDRGDRVGNVLLLTRDRDGRWEGDVDEVPSGRVHVGSGRLRLEIGEASLRFDGRFHIRAACRRRPLSVDLVLEPRAFPYLVHNAGDVQWLVAPHLVASGTVMSAGVISRIDGAPAYHDHNWGDFEGGDLAWRWVAAPSADGWSAVLVQLLDRARTRTLSQGLLLWHGEQRERSFRTGEIVCTSEGWLRRGISLSVPRALSLLAPETATDVPERLRISARGEGDNIDGEFTSMAAARVMVPRDVDLGLTIIHEVPGRLRLSGAVNGREVNVDAPAIAEFLGWAA